MLYQLVGSPGSGKTTIAANIFAALKTRGFPAEFIAEKAREVIAHRKSNGLVLDESMQDPIIESQYRAEIDFAKSTDAPVICDSSLLLTYLYLRNPEVNPLVKKLDHLMEDVSRYINTIFYCPLSNVLQYGEYAKNDANRIHSVKESDEIDRKIPEILKTKVPNTRVLVLTGDIQACTALALKEIILGIKIHA
jgi:predicted ATPase